MKKLKSVVLEEKIKEYWADSNRNIIDKKILNEYVKGDFNIELIEDIGFFEDNMDNVFKYKTIVKIFNNGNLIKKKLFWVNYNKWLGFNNKMLIEETFKLIS
jgi:hypothetical protein